MRAGTAQTNQRLKRRRRPVKRSPGKAAGVRKAKVSKQHRRIAFRAIAIIPKLLSIPNRFTHRKTRFRRIENPAAHPIRALIRSVSGPVSALASARRTIGIVLLLIGIGLFVLPVAVRYRQYAPETDAAANDTSSPRVAKPQTDRSFGPIQIDSAFTPVPLPREVPLRILVPAYNVDLPIVEAPVVNGYWETSETTASHGVGSANPGDNGNVVIFAHARKGLFLPLRDINKDTLIYVLTKDRWYRYRVTHTKLVESTDVQTVAPTEEETLTLFTCSGFLDSKRLIVTALPYYP